jgi:hypothetical protein
VITTGAIGTPGAILSIHRALQDLEVLQTNPPRGKAFAAAKSSCGSDQAQCGTAERKSPPLEAAGS